MGTANPVKTTATTSIPTPTFNVGPLTPITLAPECFDVEIVDISVDPSSTTSVRMQLGFKQKDNFGSFCFPSSYMDGVVKNNAPIFSPGSACPAGYKPKCTLVAPGLTLAAATNVEVWESLAGGDMAVGCCPSDYACAYGANRYACVSTLTDGETITAIYAANVSRTAEVTADSHTQASLIALKLLYVPAKKVDSGSGASTSAESNTPSGNATSTSAESNTLTRGQIVAIIVSILLGVFVLLVSGVLLYRRRKRKTQQALNIARDIPHTEAYSKPELDASTKIVRINELDPTTLSELPDDGGQLKACTQGIAELEGHSAILPEPPKGKPPIIHRKPVPKSLHASAPDATTSRKPVRDFTHTKEEEVLELQSGTLAP